MRLLSLLSLLVLLLSCGDASQTGKRSPGYTDTSSVAQAGPHFYRRLSGRSQSFGEVILHLQRYGDEVTARLEGGALKGFIPFNDYGDTVPNDSTYELSGYDPADRTDPADLSLIISRSDGGWTAVYTAPGRGPDAIALTEVYPAGSIALRAAAAFDTVRLRAGTAEPRALYSYGILLPLHRGDAGAYHSVAALHTLLGLPDDQGGEEERVKDVEEQESKIGEALHSIGEKYFKNYMDDVQPVYNGDVSGAMFYNYSSATRVYSVRNGGGWLVMQAVNDGYTGGAHGNSTADYVNLDLQTGRIWRLGDLISDTTGLAPVLQDAAHVTFGLRGTEPLDIRLLVKRVPVSGEVVVMPTGLLFVYDPYEIASYADGEVHLFIPYSVLRPWLTPAALDRLGIQQSAGKV